jgi:hypothetical protein
MLELGRFNLHAMKSDVLINMTSIKT